MIESGNKIILMRKDLEVAKFNFDTHWEVILNSIEIKAPHALPPCINREEQPDMYLKKWIEQRCMPKERPFFDQIIQSLGTCFIQETNLSGHGISVFDQYWFKRIDDNLNWAKVNIFSNPHTLELIKYLGRKEYDIKIHDYNASFVLPYTSSIAAGIVKTGESQVKNALYYFMPKEYLVTNYIMSNIVCPIFGIASLPFKLYIDDKHDYGIHHELPTNPNIMYVTADILINTGERNEKTQFEYLRQRCTELKIPKVDSFLDRMLCLDYVTNNTERTYKDFGFLYDVEKEEFIGIAPMFDMGHALYYGPDFIKNPTRISKMTHFDMDRNLFLIKRPDTINIDIENLGSLPKKIIEVFDSYNLDASLLSQCVQENIIALPKYLEYIMENKINPIRKMGQKLEQNKYTNMPD